MKTSISEIKYSKKQDDFVFAPFDHTFEVNEGSIRSGKSAAACMRLANFYMLSPDESHLVSGYNQEIAYKIYIEGDGLGLAYIFDGMSQLKRDRGGDNLTIDLPSGQKKIYFKGGGKSNSANSIRGMSLGSAAYTEIDLMNSEFLKETFRRTANAAIRYHLGDLNPPAPNHPILDFFSDHNAYWKHWTMQDNPVMSAKRLTELEAEFKRNPYTYKRDWLGLRVMPEGVIYSMFDQDNMTDQALIGKPIEMFFSADAGQEDATTMSCNIVTQVNVNGRYKYVLNRVANYYHSGRDTHNVKAMSTYAEELLRFTNWCKKKYQLYFNTILVDPAARSLREELKRVGLPNQGANNNAHEIAGGRKGIEVGIQRGQNLMSNGQFKIVETPDSGISMKYDHYNFNREIGTYVRDDTSGYPVDANNHAMDEFRYSVNYFYQKYGR
ncbi:PBSX family phage terminase large subunit [Companilactobacillus allii]|uniref:Terminase n=1 Tax=Companilactobacillus allii TaxID=1847728 RepID=A0A1P8Q4U1_9LACO|nr:PBSX family phage terminase large subunit [Companilactobacillus allii]APX72873.1 terminase [Companilactobacillus allii]USQ67661.1 PBSX family phage terminase large subunit [Companilactobacillus allii]